MYTYRMDGGDLNSGSKCPPYRRERSLSRTMRATSSIHRPPDPRLCRWVRRRRYQEQHPQPFLSLSPVIYRRFSCCCRCSMIIMEKAIKIVNYLPSFSLLINSLSFAQADCLSGSPFSSSLIATAAAAVEAPDLIIAGLRPSVLRRINSNLSFAAAPRSVASSSPLPRGDRRRRRGRTDELTPRNVLLGPPTHEKPL